MVAICFRRVGFQQVAEDCFSRVLSAVLSSHNGPDSCRDMLLRRGNASFLMMIDLCRYLADVSSLNEVLRGLGRDDCSVDDTEKPCTTLLPLTMARAMNETRDK
jgi:hypothetical protein